MKIDKIWNTVKNLRYGLYDESTHEMMDADKENDFKYIFKNCRIQTPLETLKNGFGTCYDRALLVAYLSNKEGLNYHYIYVEENYDSTYAFTIVEENGFYYIERPCTGEEIHNPFIKSVNSKGIHGSFDSLKDVILNYRQTVLKKDIDITLIKELEVTDWFDNPKIDLFTFFKKAASELL